LFLGTGIPPLFLLLYAMK